MHCGTIDCVLPHGDDGRVIGKPGIGFGTSERRNGAGQMLAGLKAACEAVPAS
jgi:hypothetical protein